ncbi:hypothetical protein HJC23_001557 [Cyclotella cryptica]|uniref:Guanylate cyclase domain-containing protein n=1 Tax=Cyclotella cryptica TaxID=29204 RepID=A0ABD3PXL3_9STRA|eukprot:CCRYP_010786-RA/>CCRYP_010786-RA protein AED:0.06 eAED:0.06 QI:208/1/1/1/0.66/0.5/4/707/620
MSDRRNRPSMSMSTHSEHLRNLNYNLDGSERTSASSHSVDGPVRRSLDLHMRPTLNNYRGGIIGQQLGSRRHSDYDTNRSYDDIRTMGHQPGSRRSSNPDTYPSTSSGSSHSVHGFSSVRSCPKFHPQQPPKVQYNTSNSGSSAGLHSSRFNYDVNDRFDDDMTTTTSTQSLNPSKLNRAKNLACPEGDVTIVFTDVQGSTSLWEACPTDMKKAVDIHDMIMRQCYTNHKGYEILTEGDAFFLAFHHPVDALAFALEAQLKLYKANWPPGILKHDDAKDEPSLKFRGFRVRFGIHHGPTLTRVHETTRRTVYSGESVKIAKAIEGMCHGGQILCSVETWMAVSGMAERYLGRPQCLDCGEHLLFETIEDGVTTKFVRRIIQIVPQELSFDFFEARGRKEVPSTDGSNTMRMEVKDASHVKGRLFPPVVSKKQYTTGFLNAPHKNGRVTICFVYTEGLDGLPCREQNLTVIAKHVRRKLLETSPPGYECQEDNGAWMIAFDRMANAVNFGLQLVNDSVALVGRVDVFKIGIVTGEYTSMGPHRTTGMADYFGPIVNRAARVASNSKLGTVCVGIPQANGVMADPPDFGPTVSVRLEGIKKLKGISIDTAIFSCHTRRIQRF